MDPLVVVFSIPEERRGIMMPISKEKALMLGISTQGLLRTSPTSRAAVSLVHFGYEFEVRNGLDGRHLPTVGESPNLVVHTPVPSIGRQISFNASRMSRGQLGCFASHIAAWDTGCQQGRQVISMEADVVAQARWDGLTDADFEGYDLVLVHDHPLRKNRGVPCPSRVVHVDGALPGWWYAMGATLIRPKSCTKVLNLLADTFVQTQVDVWLEKELPRRRLRVGQLCESPRFLQTKDVPSRATYLVDGKVPWKEGAHTLTIVDDLTSSPQRKPERSIGA